jgi:hypothetical protein
MRRATLTCLALLIGLPLAGAAQELPKAKKYDNAKWYRIVNYTFKPGMTDSALKVATEHFDPARRAAGVPIPQRFRHVDGQWDVTVIVPMVGGPSELEYEVTPQAEKFMAALAKQEGGPTQARAAQRQFASYILRGESYIVHELAPVMTAARTP